MAKAVARPKKTAAKSKPSVRARAKAAPPARARKALKKSPAKPAPKPASKVAASKPALDVAKSGKWVFTFGDGKAEGKAGLRDLLGGKGANLAEMANLGLPVPPGFTIPTSVCTYFYAHDKSYPGALKAQVEKALDHVGKLTGKSFGDSKNPLLVSVRSGGRASMPARTARAPRSTSITPATTGSSWSASTRRRWPAEPLRISPRIPMRNCGV